MAVGMGVVPSEIDANFRWADILEVGVELCSSSKHGEWIGFDTTHCSER